MVNKSLEILKGELTKKEEKQSSGKKTFWSLEIAGLGKAGVWDKKIADMLHVGNTYEYSYESDGKYNTIQSVKEVAQPTPETPKPAKPPAEHSQGYMPVPKDNQAIMAQVALKSAVERANGIVGRELLTKEVIQIGQEYFRAMQAWAQGKVYTSTTEPPAPAVSPQRAMQAWAQGKVYTSTTEPPAPAVSPQAVHVVSTHVGPAEPLKQAPEGKQGQGKLGQEDVDRVSRALAAAGWLPEKRPELYEGKWFKTNFPGFTTIPDMSKADAERLIKALELAVNSKQAQKVPAQGKIMQDESGEPW